MDNFKDSGKKFVKIVWLFVLAALFLTPDCFLRIRKNITDRKLEEYNMETLRYLIEEMNEKKASEETKEAENSDIVSEHLITTESSVITTKADVTSSTTAAETTYVQETTVTSAVTVAEDTPEPSQQAPVESSVVYEEPPMQQYVDPVPQPEPEPEPEPEPQQPVQNAAYSYEQSEILRLINEIRSAHGLPGFIMTDQVNAAASVRAEETTRSFSHTRPDGRDCFSVANDLGISAMTMGENIACGNSSPEKTVEQWMNSEGHRDNILNPSFTMMGVGFARATDVYGYYWAQFFIG